MAPFHAMRVGDKERSGCRCCSLNLLLSTTGMIAACTRCYTAGQSSAAAPSVCNARRTALYLRVSCQCAPSSAFACKPLMTQPAPPPPAQAALLSPEPFGSRASVWAQPHRRLLEADEAGAPPMRRAATPTGTFVTASSDMPA